MQTFGIWTRFDPDECRTSRANFARATLAHRFRAGALALKGAAAVATEHLACIPRPASGRAEIGRRLLLLGRLPSEKLCIALTEDAILQQRFINSFGRGPKNASKKLCGPLLSQMRPLG